MIEIHLLCTVTPKPDGMGLDKANLDTAAFVCPHRIDTITTLPPGFVEMNSLPMFAKSVVRYHDPVVGYRLMYVSDAAGDIADARRRELRGEDPEEFEID